MIKTLNIYDNPVLGVFATCTEDVALVPIGTTEKAIGVLAELLDVEVVSTLINGSIVVGSLSRGNSNGFLVSRGASVRDLKDVDVPVEVLPDRLTAVGNVILANDTAALVHPDMSDKSLEQISRVLGVDVHRGTIAGLGTVGMAGAVTNRGVLVHPMTTQQELSVLEDVFSLPIEVGTTNYGSQAVGSGLLANSKGYVAGSNTTGHELGRVEDALFFA
ncbi:translation initiation factor IF-6 [Methanococcoides sp. SA1]|nr:translation initiation factor IF-6 [Methanococcoides sp. SA1]